MIQIEVNLTFDVDDDEPMFYVTDDGKMKWPYDVVLAYDWKEERAQARGYAKLRKNGNVVLLFDGSDTIIYANMKDAIKA